MSHSPALPIDTLYRFGEFLVDPVIGRLYYGIDEVPLTRKTFDVLTVLVRHEGQLVEKDDLFRLIWPDTVVEDNNLARCVSMLRKALRERNPVPEFIITFPGRGYRFSVPVEPVRRADLSGLFGSMAWTQAHASSAPGVPGQRPDPDATVPPSVPVISPTALSQPARRPSWRQITAALVTATLMAAPVGWMTPPRAERDREKRLWQLTSMSGLEVEPTWSPDGRFIAYSSNRSGNFDIWVQDVLGGDAIRITSTEASESQPAWSPDGREIAFRSEQDGGGLFVMPAFGGAARRLTRFGYEPMWSPDGSKLLFYLSRRPLRNRAFITTLDGQPPREILAPFLAGLGELGSFRLAWHPDGRVSVLGLQIEGDWTFFTATLDDRSRVRAVLSTSVRKRLRDLDLEFGRFIWVQDGGSLLLEGVSQGARNLYRVSVDPITMAWIAGPTPLTTSTSLLTDIALSADGHRLALSSRITETQVWAFPFDPACQRLAGEGESVTPRSADVRRFEVSPDGDRLAYWTRRNGRQELWVRSMRSKSEELKAVEPDSWPVRWSPDSQSIVYARETAASSRTELVPVSLRNQRDQPRSSEAPPRLEWLAPYSMLRSCATGARNGICAIDATEGTQARRRLVAADPTRSLFEARTSPDGRWISLIARADASRSTAYLMPADGGAWIPLSEESHTYVDKPRWLPDGSIVYFVSDRFGALNVWGRHVDSNTGRVLGPSFQVTKFETPERLVPERLGGLGVAVTRDQLLLPLTNASGAVWVLDNFDQ
jgi:Tol biopolymer transport system component/DNA-binding winged helix-turn-helix (wHTH) protein